MANTRQRIYTAECLVTNHAPPVIGGALLDVNGRIAEVGSVAALSRSYPGVEVIDFGQRLLVPAMVNAHTHLELTSFPDWATEAGIEEDPSNFVDWILQVIKVKRAQHQKVFEPSVVEGIRQTLAAGVAAVGDILSYLPARIAYRNTPILGNLYLETLGHDPALTREMLAAINSVLMKNPFGQLKYGISPHAPYSISGEYLRQVFKKCQRNNFPCATHIGESAEEVEFINSSQGPMAEVLYPFVGWRYNIPVPRYKRPAEYLDSRGGLFKGNLLVHGVHLDDAEIELVAKANCSLVLCPRSNARLKVGKAPLAKLLKAGVPLALGTDSRASTDSLSIWDEMAFASDWFEGQISSLELFRLATEGGARALGLENEIGDLKPGLRSSFQVINLKKFPKLSDIHEQLVGSGSSVEVEKLYLDGLSVLPDKP